MRVLLLAFSVSETCFIPSDYSVVIIQMYLQELLACCCIKTGRYTSGYCTKYSGGLLMPSALKEKKDATTLQSGRGFKKAAEGKYC